MLTAVLTSSLAFLREHQRLSSLVLLWVLWCEVPHHAKTEVGLNLLLGLHDLTLDHFCHIKMRLRPFLLHLKILLHLLNL